jgi:hypothetical protein
MMISKMVYELGVQEKWLNGKMSNFDYLMALNTLAGRSFNDLCQVSITPFCVVTESNFSDHLTSFIVSCDAMGSE